jgi:thiamine pyrophosphokinase
MTIREADAVILAAGDFPSHPIPVAVLEQHRDRIICCDSAADTLLRAGFYPVAVVGDCDSISAESRKKLSDRFFHDPDQYTNDLTKAVHYCQMRSCKRLLILGATGKREDHTLGNISLLADYMDIVDVEMITDHGIFTPVTGRTVFESSAGQQISIFCMDQAPLTLQGLRWPLTRQVLSGWWQGTLNEALFDSFVVETSGKAVVFRNW